MDANLALSFQILHNLTSSALVGALVAATLLYLSVRDHTRTGPRVKDEIARHYIRYALYALTRLGVWCFIIAFLLATAGASLYFLTIQALDSAYSYPLLFLSGLLCVTLVSTYLFAHYLLYIPSLLIGSARFRFSRLSPIWKQLSPARLKTVRWFIALIIASILVSGLRQLLLNGQWHTAFFYTVQSTLYLCFYVWVATCKTARPEGKTPLRKNNNPPPIS